MKSIVYFNGKDPFHQFSIKFNPRGEFQGRHDLHSLVIKVWSYELTSLVNIPFAFAVNLFVLRRLKLMMIGGRLMGGEIIARHCERDREVEKRREGKRDKAKLDSE